MRGLFFGAALFAFAVSAVKLGEALYAARKVPTLAGEKPSEPPSGFPRLSVVVPARNEEDGLEVSLGSMLAQDYPALEVVLVDDRSSDGTGRVMERVAAGRENVRVVHVEGLPEGWLGKNHAAYAGAALASGEWLLFTDADVRFRRDAVRRAVLYAEEHGLDHLTLVPDLDLKGYWLRSAVAFFYVAFLLYRGYYRANVPSFKTGVGIGAFNLIRRRAYEEIGTYRAFALRPDDDLSLGARVKKLGLRQRILGGYGLLSVEWYGSLGALIQGVEKNVFPALDYGLVKVAGYFAGLLTVTVWPFAGVFVTDGSARLLCLSAVAAQFGAYVMVNRFLGWRVFPLALGYPACALLFAGVLVRSTALALLRGGIYWRGTFYPLSLLKLGADKSILPRDP
ncbi:MAG: glycosyltransferase [Rubrobacteraceae bacterium]